MQRAQGRPSYLKIIYNRNYKVGLCLAALRLYGEMKTTELAEKVGLHANGIKHLMKDCEDIEFERASHTWHYETMGTRKNYTVKRAVWLLRLKG